MARTYINFRTWIALILLGVLIVLFASLGNWQLDRAALRDAIHAQIKHASQLEPIELRAGISPDELTPWRHAHARGNWLHRYTVLLENRNHQGRPGYWVATPLQLTGTAATDVDTSGTAVLVLRGWIARDDMTQYHDDHVARINPQIASELAQDDEEQDITGELFAHVPRLFELWSWSGSEHAQLPEQITDTRQALPALQNLPLIDYARSTGLNLLPIVLAQTSPEHAMIQDWPHPSSDADTNRGYALQWFSFCAIAAGAWLFIGWRAIRPSRRTPS